MYDVCVTDCQINQPCSVNVYIITSDVVLVDVNLLIGLVGVWYNS